MARDELQLLQGTLDVLVLKTLSWGPRHGYAIARWIKAELTDAEQVLYVEEDATCGHQAALHSLANRPASCSMLVWWSNWPRM